MEDILILILLLVIYFVPSIAALIRNHHNTVAIIILNVFAGWTFIGWLGALVWSATVVKGPNGGY